MRVLTVVGNRPQFVKSAPLSLALREAGIDEAVLHTGQHWDPEMSQVFFDELGLPEPAYRLDLRTADATAMTTPIREAVERERPDWVIVMGDTNTTLAGAHAAGEEVPVAHVEAGLRSFDLSMPEERNRIEVDRLAALLLTPDERSARQLASEGVPGRSVVVGDVMADATRIFLPIAQRRELPYATPYDVLTLHREANTEPGRLRRLLDAVGGLGRHVVFPAHPRTRRVIEAERIPLAAAIELVEPLGYLEMLALVAAAETVLTDSGGLQKEAYWLGVPCVTLRSTTEWVDTVEVGANTLVDPDDPSRLGRAVAEARFPADAPSLYGDGHAAERVAAALYA
jgi:UDP-GlcNAc3NAcA epimerase